MNYAISAFLLLCLTYFAQRMGDLKSNEKDFPFDWAGLCFMVVACGASALSLVGQVAR